MMKNCVTLFLIMALSATLLCQTKKTKKMEVKIRNVESFEIIYYEFTGSYKDAFSEYEHLMNFVKENNVTMGPYYVGVYFDNPEEVPENELKSWPGHMVSGKFKENETYKYKKYKACKAVSVTYNTMEEIMLAYAALGKYVQENNIDTEPYSIEVYKSEDPKNMDAEILMFIK